MVEPDVADTISLDTVFVARDEVLPAPGRELRHAVEPEWIELRV